MRRFNKTSVGLDIGSRYIKFVELKKAGDNIILNRLGVKEIPADMKPDKELYQLILQLLSENNIKTRSVIISAGGQ